MASLSTVAFLWSSLCVFKFHTPTHPLAGLPELSSHPSNDSNSSSGWESLLPSVFEDPDQAFELLDKAHRTLDDYARDHFGDDTKAPLNAFLDHLPTKGQEVLAREIVEYAEDHGKLRALRHFLVDAIVKALRVAGGGAPSIGPSPSPGAAAEVEADMASIEVSTKAEQTKLREDCLNRDGQHAQQGDDMGIRYRCHKFYEPLGLYGQAMPEVVTLQQHSLGQSIPMPNRHLLRVHYIVAKILSTDTYTVERRILRLDSKAFVYITAWFCP
ncbi:uncharacterized protein B0T15DRAFT_508876 [Chaetomium strumarium]|uniref:Uncharacterized protein n=1 Tax=Chaetomium strumarium TaxID=1170767 RepID=A0AAJ0GYA2_9PEZI|nr:hypothetical protein B0T15DRAFT_508876 [Chaetomium strumarium]